MDSTAKSCAEVEVSCVLSRASSCGPLLTSPRHEKQKLCAVRVVGHPKAGPMAKQRRPKGYWKHMYIERQEKTHPVKLTVRLFVESTAVFMYLERSYYST